MSRRADSRTTSRIEWVAMAIGTLPFSRQRMWFSVIRSNRSTSGQRQPAALRSAARARARWAPVSAPRSAPPDAAISLSRVAGSSCHVRAESSNSLNPRNPNSSRNRSRLRVPRATSPIAAVASRRWIPPTPVTAWVTRASAPSPTMGATVSFSFLNRAAEMTLASTCGTR